MEGTTLGRVGTMEGFKTETDLENDFFRAFRETDGLHLVWASSQNIDRLVTIYKAANKAKRLFIIDLYTAEILFPNRAGQMFVYILPIGNESKL